MGGKKENLKWVREQDPELATKRNAQAAFGFRALHYACEYSGPDPVGIVQVLLDAGAATTVNTPDDLVGLPSYCLESIWYSTSLKSMHRVLRVFCPREMLLCTLS